MSLGRLKRRLRPAPPAGAPDPDFDPAFYRARYSDLKSLPDDAALWRHFSAFGRAEGRHPNQKAAITALEREIAPLPADFDPRTYRTLHADLRAAIKTDWDAAEHYLRFGKAEKRPYVRFDPELYRALYFADKVVTDYELKLDYRERGRAEGRVGAWSEFMAREGLPSGDWVDRLKLDEFELLNWSWCGPVPSKLDAVRRFLAEGVDRIAPLAFDTAFEPAYYAEAHPELAGLAPAELHRRWLFEGLPLGEPGSAEEHLRTLRLPLRRYPGAFDWRAHAGGRRELNTPWKALTDFVEIFDPSAASPVAGEGAAELYAALGQRLQRRRKDAAAVVAFQRARAAGDLSYDGAHELADALYRQKRWAEALPLFLEAAEASGAKVWTFVNGAKTASALGDHEAAVRLVELGKLAYGGDPLWREAVQAAVEAVFKAATDEARKLYGKDDRAGADAAVAAAVESARALWARLDPIGAPLPAFGEPGRVVILASFDLRVCVHYRIEQKQELFDHLGRPCEVFALEEWEDFIAALPGAAAAIIFRLPAWPSVVRAIDAARTMGVPTYYEIDDLIFDAEQYPDTLESYGGLLSAEDYEGLLYGVPLFRAAIEMCDYGIVSTTPLKRAVEPLVRTGQVFWLPNGLDSRNEPWLDQPPPRVRRDGDILIAYASGTKAHNSDFNELAGPALVELLTRRKDVRLLLVGYLALDPAFDAVRDQIIRFDYVGSSESFWSMLADADISFAVLKPTWATDAKSEIKWLEAAVLGIPSVVSETAMYAEVLDDGQDALIVRTPAEWLSALDRLAGDAELRRRIGDKARAKARARYSVEANAARLQALLAPADARRAAAAPKARPRILLANVWFPPQTLGGATRVVRDNLDAWLDAGLGEAFEFAVFTTDAGATKPYQLRTDTYRGVPVLRISTPMEANMDWKPEDLAVGAVFAEFLQAWRPDLVHFHAAQRLTATPAEACRRMGVPYLVTTHDAWWLSDWHFLVDDEGRLHAPCEDLPRHPPEEVSVAQSLDRRRVLRTALEGAEAVLGVSESFARMHRACGVERAIAVPNGVSALPTAARRRSPSGRVRLAHVGTSPSTRDTI
jgi:glycosyltransferase involved in cell wall biosynthesis